MSMRCSTRVMLRASSRPRWCEPEGGICRPLSIAIMPLACGEQASREKEGEERVGGRGGGTQSYTELITNISQQVRPSLHGGVGALLCQHGAHNTLLRKVITPAPTVQSVISICRSTRDEPTRVIEHIGESRTRNVHSANTFV